MPRKPKFKPIVTRVKLNPEQAVLACSCYTRSKGVLPMISGYVGPRYVCVGWTRSMTFLGDGNPRCVFSGYSGRGMSSAAS